MKKWKSKWAVLAVVGTLFTNTSTQLHAKEIPYILHDTTVANTILDHAYRYVGSLEKFAFEGITVNDDLYEDKMIVEVKHRVFVKVDRPGDMMIDVEGDSKNRRIYLHKGEFTIYDKEKGYYGVLKTPRGIDHTLDYIFNHYDIKTPLANLLYSDIAKRLKPQSKGYYFGLKNVGKILCDHIGFSNTKEELQLWIARGESPVIMKFIVIDKTGKRELRSTTVLHWYKNSKSKSDHYIFKAPANAVKINIEVPEVRSSHEK
jgi:hypothetical protein